MVTAAKASSATLKYYLMLFFFGVPISFVSVLMDLDQLERDFPPLEWLFDFLGDAIRAQIAAFLPNLALIVFMALLPKICAQFAAEHGKANLADVQVGAIMNLWVFYFVWVLFGAAAVSALFGGNLSVEKLATDMANVVDLHMVFLVIQVR
ncbi:MAG: hypothetical protein SGPRY_002587 [Prymnesium sp.]